MKSGRSGFGLESGSGSAATGAFSKASMTFEESSGRGKVMSSCKSRQVNNQNKDEIINSELGETKTYRKGLSIPLFNFDNRGHIVKTIRKLMELTDTMGKTDRKLLGQKLACSEKSTLGGILAWRKETNMGN